MAHPFAGPFLLLDDLSGLFCTKTYTLSEIHQVEVRPLVWCEPEMLCLQKTAAILLYTPAAPGASCARLPMGHVCPTWCRTANGATLQMVPHCHCLWCLWCTWEEHLAPICSSIVVPLMVLYTSDGALCLRWCSVPLVVSCTSDGTLYL